MRVKLAALLAAALMLCGCQTHLSLKDRAIVRAVYVNKENGEAVVSILAYESKPETDISSAQGTPKIYTGQGSDINTAFEKAEASQNRRLFYAHNRLLLIGSGYVDDISPCIQYFGSGALPRDMAVFLADFNSKQFEKWQDEADLFVREGEALADKGASAIYEINAAETPCGFLPLLSSNADEKTLRCAQMLLFNNGAPFAVCEKNAMRLVLALSGKAGEIEVSKGDVTARLKVTNIEREATANSASAKLYLNILTASKNGAAISDEALPAAAATLEAALDSTLDAMAAQTSQSSADIFGLAAYRAMRGYGQAASPRTAFSCKVYK